MSERITKLLSLELDDRVKLLYEWVKMGVVTLGEFRKIVVYVKLTT